MINAPLIALLVVLLTAQATWIYVDARKRGENAILWAIFGLLNVPSSLIIYLIVTRIGKRKCPGCNKIIEKKFNNCPYCKEKLHNTCLKCSCKIEEDWEYCPNCTNELK
ncbi:MAG: double zinc ribbon domain-containing protein [Deltaproteobacteria bacterium]